MKKSGNYFLLVPLALLLAAFSRPADISRAPMGIQLCRMQIHIFVQQGLNAGYTVSGKVDFGSAIWSDFNGQLIEENGQPHIVAFSFEERGVRFILYIDQGIVYGTGMMENGMSFCTGTGGGTISGPDASDLGGWRATWISEAIPDPTPTPNQNPAPQPAKQQKEPDYFTIVCLGVPAIFVLWMAITIVRRIVGPYNSTKKYASKKGAPPAFSMHRPNQGKRASAPGENTPLVEYTATYLAGNALFDDSFNVEKAGLYVGECGIAARNITDRTSRQANAFEVWLFDTRSAQTVTKFLMGEYCYSYENYTSTVGKDQAILLHTGQTTSLDTPGLTARVQVVELEYDTANPKPRSVFKKVVLKVSVW